MIHGYCPCGLLHSDICGSMFACNYPQLFAAYHVLLRLLMPRHSPYALISLTILNYALFASKSSCCLRIFALSLIVVNTRLKNYFFSFLSFISSFAFTFSFIQFSSCYLNNAQYTLFVSFRSLGGHKWTRTTDLTLIRRAL